MDERNPRTENDDVVSDRDESRTNEEDLIGAADDEFEDVDDFEDEDENDSVEDVDD